MPKFPPRLGLIAATHTPFHADRSINLDAIPGQAEALLRLGVQTVFVCGTTGESASLTIEERIAVANRWMNVIKGTKLEVIAHVGHNCQQDAVALAAAAAKAGVHGLAAMAPCFFKPTDIHDLVQFMIPVAGAAPEVPFYYYDIPSMTGVTLPSLKFLEQAAAIIPSLAGLKFTNTDSIQLQECLEFSAERFDILYGVDENLLCGLTLGTKGAVGSSYNFAAPIYHRVIAAFERGDFETARREQADSIRLIRCLASFGYLPAAKHVMEMLGVAVGPARLPLKQLSSEEKSRLERALQESDLWEKLRPDSRL